jgi:hypothetical protein
MSRKRTPAKTTPKSRGGGGLIAKSQDVLDQASRVVEVVEVEAPRFGNEYANAQQRAEQRRGGPAGTGKDRGK